MSSPHVLEIPDWVPAEVAGAARIIVSVEETPPEVVDVTQRLLSNVQMKKVWTELMRNRREDYRPSGESFHQIQLPREIESWGAMAGTWKGLATENQGLGDGKFARQFGFLSMAAEVIEHKNPSPPIPDSMRHGLALALFFSIAVTLYCAADRSITKNGVERWENTLRERGLDGRSNAVRSFVAKPEVSRLVVERQRSDPRLRAFVVSFALQIEHIFGSPLARTIATTANVAFDLTESRMITYETVKAILKKLP